MRCCIALIPILLLAGADRTVGPSGAPIYLWYEPEWFDGVQGHFAYWTGTAKPTGHWGVAGPGISAEWSQGGESEWNSMGACAEETKAVCSREIRVPRAGKYGVWVRYADHRHKSEPFTVRLEQKGKAVITGELGIQSLVPPNDEYMLYWGFAFGWGKLEGNLEAGPATLSLLIEKSGQAWRQVDALLISDDLQYQPTGREKPPFDYTNSFKLRPTHSSAWRGNWQGPKETVTIKPVTPIGITDFGSRTVIIPLQTPSELRGRLGGRDFSMWTQIDADSKWWSQQKLDALNNYELFLQFSPPQDIREKFHKEFAGKKDLPIMSFRDLLPGFYLGTSPDLSAESPVRRWLERTKTPFYILTNYAGPQYMEKTGSATYQALTGPLAEQFLGYIHGEAVGSPGVSLPDKPLAASRRGHVDALGKHLMKEQAKRWSEVYKTAVPESHWAKGISCLSVDSIALAHLFHETGAKVVGYELDATNAHAPMRIAFERGAARQYGGAWINYASGNFGDACNYFTQNPVVNRGAGGWFHSKYAVTDGVSASWYRRMYYLNYLSGASANFWEQGLGNQWMLPGPGTHPIQLSPFGRATVDFQEFVKRLPDRGEPCTPIALLLSHGHGYERVNYHCKMLQHFPENEADRELRELFNVCWHPSGVVEGQAAAPDLQSLPNGVYGNIFDVLVDRPQRAKALLDYPIVYAAGDVDLSGAMMPHIEEYLKRGGTLVVNIEATKGLPTNLLGLKPTGKKRVLEAWAPGQGEFFVGAVGGSDPLRPGHLQRSTPYELIDVELQGAKPLAFAAELDPETARTHLPFASQTIPLITRHAVGPGAVIVTLTPRMLGLDERAHPALPWLMNGLTTGLLPIRVLMHHEAKQAGSTIMLGPSNHIINDRAVDEPNGEIMYQINRTKDGYLVLLMNNRGVDKTQSGIARVDRRAYVDIALWPSLPVKSAKELTQPRELRIEKLGDAVQEVRIRVHPGDVQVIHFASK